jgi:predicted RNA-binding Zn ribbon-like protein
MNRNLPVAVEPHVFSARDFVGGDPAIDFVNTVTGRDQLPRDWLDSYARLLDWAALVKILPADALQQLAKQAKRQPAAAAGALARAKVLRENLFSLLAGIKSGSAPSKDVLALLRKHWVAGVSAHELRWDNGQVVMELRNEVDLDLIASTVAYRIVEHVLARPMDRLRMCQGSNCSWLFVDTSKGGRRRWCDMAVCGNAAKSRRFYARTRSD